jgi:hypothetical protein
LGALSGGRFYPGQPAGAAALAGDGGPLDSA